MIKRLPRKQKKRLKKELKKYVISYHDLSYDDFYNGKMFNNNDWAIPSIQLFVPLSLNGSLFSRYNVIL